MVLLIPAAAHAQGGSITGIVKDTSGAVLPGVTVEASSPILIEKTRSVVTGSIRVIMAGHKTPSVFYIKPEDHTLYVTNFDTGVTRKPGVVPPRGSIATINADETLAAVRAYISDERLFEIVFLAGYYMIIARVIAVGDLEIDDKHLDLSVRAR